MTDQNHAAQPVLTDEEIQSIWIEHGLDNEAVEGFARAIECALLSKLRAPVSTGPVSDRNRCLELENYGEILVPCATCGGFGFQQQVICAVCEGSGLECFDDADRLWAELRTAVNKYRLAVVAEASFVHSPQLEAAWDGIREAIRAWLRGLEC